MKFNSVWYEKTANSCPIENCLVYNQYIMKDINKFRFLTKSLHKELTKIFGTPDGKYPQKSFHYLVWVRDFEGESFIIFTALNKGTKIEICDTTLKELPEKTTAIINFIDDLYMLLTSKE
jgi:hypothetical protein